jgi:hypothetical protein
LSTAVANRPAPGTQVPATTSSAVAGRPPRRGLLRRFGHLRRTTPGRLQLILGMLLTLGLLTGLVAGLAGNATRGGTTDLGGRAQPLFAEAETIYSALADADTTAAQAFLAGGLEPAPLSRRYQADLDRATAALSSAARRTPEGSASADAVRELSSGVAQYAALVATARADNRQGLPVGASYLAAASRLDRETLLPRAQSLFDTAQSEVDDGFGDATSAGWLVLLVVLLLALFIALIWTQLQLSHTTHRTFNLRLLAATVLTVALAVIAGVTFIAQNHHLNRAANEGSAPMKSLAEARIQALELRADEALSLVARNGGGTGEDAWTAGSKQLTEPGGPMSNGAYGALDPALGASMDQAVTDFRAYAAQHTKVHDLDSGGDYDGAVRLAIGAGTTTPFEAVRGALDTAFTGRKAVFTQQIEAADRGLGLFTVLGPVLALAVCALAAAGLRPRIEEYR